jgi:predicted transcriptional regulator
VLQETSSKVCYEEIAQEVGVTIETVSTALHEIVDALVQANLIQNKAVNITL